MLRGLLALLVLANLLFFAWAQGWLGVLAPPPSYGQREPARLGAQRWPERVGVLPAPEAGPALAAARSAALTCLEAGPFGEAAVGTAEAALRVAGLPEGGWRREPMQLGAGWVLFAGRYPDAAVRQARADALTRLGLTVETIEAPPELAPGLVISRHASRDAAELALAAVADRPLAGVRVVAVPASPLQHRLRVPEADPALQARLADLGLTFRPCVAAR